MTRYTIELFQMAYPDQIRIDRHKVEKGIHIECWLLNEDKETPHMLLFDGGPFPDDKAVDDTIQNLLNFKED